MGQLGNISLLRSRFDGYLPVGSISSNFLILIFPVRIPQALFENFSAVLAR